MAEFNLFRVCKVFYLPILMRNIYLSVMRIGIAAA